MRNYSGVLVVVGSYCMLAALVLAWCLVGVRSTAFMKRVFPSYQYLLKAHIDYLLMTGLLMIFFLLFTHFRVSPSPLGVVTMSLGSVVNPLGFLALALKPTLRQSPASPFGIVMTVSFTAATIGYGSAAWSVGLAALGTL